MLTFKRNHGRQRQMNLILSQSHGPRRLKKRYLRLLQGGAVLLVLMFGVVFLNFNASQELYTQSMNGKKELELAKTHLASEDFEGATKNIENARRSFESAKNAADGMTLVRYIPFASRQVNAIRHILETGIQMTSAATTFAQIGAKTMTIVEKSQTVSFADISAEQKADVLKVLYESPPELKGAEAQIQLAKQSMQRIPTYGLLPPIRDVANELREQFGVMERGVGAALPTIEALPRIIGYPGEKNYLFLLENNSELRPTGGFIGTYGILKVRYGEITFFETDNIYNLDNAAHGRLVVEPPPPLAQYLRATQWLMRDANWDPDFPTSAAKALWFYKEESQSMERIDGVIAITPTFIQSLLKITGDITVKKITFTSENLVDTLQRIVEKDFTAYGLNDSTRKQIIGDLSKELLDTLLHLPQNRWPELWDIFQSDIRSKHVLMYLEDPELQKLAVEQGWAGEVKQTDHDYVFVVDANLASLKSDPNVFRKYEYSVRQDEQGRMVATLNMTYNNKNDLTFFTTRYHTYIRVYVPEGSTLLKTTGAEDEVIVGAEHGKTVFETYKTIEFQDQETLTFEYLLPERITQEAQAGQYLLLIQKQAGAAAYELEVDIQPGQDVTEFSPIQKGRTREKEGVHFSTALDSDQAFMVGFQSSTPK